MAQGGWTYIITDRPFGVLYTGVTADIVARIVAHREKSGSKFAKKWDCTLLVLVEFHETIEEAIIREKRLKNWKRQWKLRLISESNPNWDDLFAAINC